MKLYNQENELMDRLNEDIFECNKERIVFLAGHFPVNYDQEMAYADLTQWGCFSAYTLQLASQLATVARNQGRKIGFALIADDFFNEKAALNWHDNKKLSRWRGAFYRQHSGKDGRTHPTFESIFANNGFGIEHIIRQDQEKKGRRDSLYISEKVLRAERGHIKAECAKSYLGFLNNKNLFDKEKDHLVAFIPTKCRDNICNIALPEIDELSSSHVFMPSVKGIFPSDIWGAQRVIYQKE
jgi:hypothetical protein